MCTLILGAIQPGQHVICGSDQCSPKMCIDRVEYFGLLTTRLARTAHAASISVLLPVGSSFDDDEHGLLSFCTSVLPISHAQEA